jgi:very-short-patch-repair endonuclease
MKPEKTVSARRMRKHPTPGEAAMWAELRRKALGHRFHRQVPILGWIADFYCPAWRLVVEVDGPYHEDRKAYDALRDQVMRDHGLRVIRIAEDDAVHHTRDVATLLSQVGPQSAYAIQGVLPSPSRAAH